MKIQHLPILGICGSRVSGKDSLIEHTISRVIDKGLKVVVTKDTANDTSFLDMLPSLARKYDLVVVDGHVNTLVPNIRLVSDIVSESQQSTEYVLAELTEVDDRLGFIDNFVDIFLARQWLKPPVVGCILIGGNSTRMGRPKHLIMQNGKLWIENTIDLLRSVTDHVVVIGKGEIPETDVSRLADIPNCQGPLSGVLAACRQYPWSSLLVCACDLPDLTTSALEWLLAQRSVGAWSILPQNGEHYEPLLALYDFRMGTFFENMLSVENYKLSAVASAQNVKIVEPPTELRTAWRNVNFVEQITS